jgi:membrane associated rhomboid family serine protease
MSYTGIITLAIILSNVVISWKGFKSRTFFNKYEFEVERIRLYREYRRLITCGFLHVSWKHLIFNMISLLLFSVMLEADMGPAAYVCIYLGSLIGGNLLSLYIHRRESDYSAVGASGAICGIIFASIVLYPGMMVSFFGLFPVPGWVYGIVYILYAIYGIKSRRDNIGHDAHLGGAMAGMLIGLMIEPAMIMQHIAVIIALTVPCVFFMYVIIHKPHIILVDNYYYNQHHVLADIDDLYNVEKANRQRELDAILDKIHHKGINSLTKTEKEKLERYSRQIS